MRSLGAAILAAAGVLLMIWGFENSGPESFVAVFIGGLMIGSAITQAVTP